MSDGGSKKQTSVQSSAPWGPQGVMWQKSWKDLDRLKAAGGLKIRPYMGDRVADPAPQTVQSWDMITGMAGGGAPTVDAANRYATDVLGGKYLSGDAPGLQSILDRTQTAVNANYNKMGRSYSGSHDAAVAGAVAPILYQNYNDRLAQMNQLAGMAPQLDQARYYGAGLLGQVGQQRQAQLQDEINSQIALQQELQRVPINELALYQDFIGGSLGGTTTSTQPMQGSNPWLQGLGTAATIGSLFL